MPDIFGNPTPEDERNGLLTSTPDVLGGTGTPEKIQTMADDFVTRQAEVNVKASRDTNSDQFAEDRKTAKELGIDTSLVEAAPEEARTMADDFVARTSLEDAPATARFLTDPENAKLAHRNVSSLSTIERLTRGFRRGVYTSELGRAGEELRRGDTSQEAKDRVAFIQDRIKELGQDDEGVISAFVGVMEFLGQRLSAYNDSKAITMPLAGAGLGAGTGLAGGIFAPITVPVGAIVGFESGVIAHQMLDIANVEAGLAYVDQIEAGVDPQVAKWTSLGVGVINAGLEAAGGTSFLRPLSQAGKKAFREGLRGVVKNPKFVEAMGSFGANYATNIGVETATEVTQELVNIAAEEMGKSLTDGMEAEWTPEEWTERLTDIAIKTMKTTSILAAPGSSYRFVLDAREARSANANAKKLKEVRENVAASPLAVRAPDKAAEHVADSFSESGIDSIYISAEDLAEAAQASGNAAEFIDLLGATEQMSKAQPFNGDVRVDMAAFVEHVMLNENTAMADMLEQSAKLDPEGISAKDAASALELSEVTAADLAFEEVANEAPEARADREAVTLAERETGMIGLFRTAQEAGLTEKQFSSYVQAIMEAREEGVRAKERSRLKREQRKNEKDYQKRAEGLKQSASESVSQEPLYQAVLGVGRDQLDHNKTLALLNGNVEALKRLPKVNGRSIVAPKGTKGVDPDLHADVHGFEGGDIMLFNMLDKPSFEEAVEARIAQHMEETHPTLLDKRGEINEALQALHEPVNYSDVLAYELNWMRQARKEKRVSQKLIRERAQTILRDMQLRDITPRQLEATARREGTRARKALREGDIATAARAKLNQAVAFAATKEAYAINDRVERGNKYLNKFTQPKRKFKTLPIDTLEQIRDMLSAYSFRPTLSRKSAKALREFQEGKLANDGVVYKMPPYAEERSDPTRKNYQDMTYAEWENALNVIRALEKQGNDENKFLREQEKQTREEAVQDIIAVVQQSLSANRRSTAKNVQEVTDISRLETALERFRETRKKYGIGSLTVLLTPDFFVRMMDGGTDLGPSYRNIKGRIDRALTEGYQDGQIGYVRRMKGVSEELNALFNVYSKEEKRELSRQQDIPGVRARLTKREQLAVLLNLGNEENRTAMLEGRDLNGDPQFTEGELDAILANASEKDMNFVQNVWDYLDTLWPEVEATLRRRENRTVEKVEPREVMHPKYGSFRGGYYPLSYDNSETIPAAITLEETKDKVLYGSFISGHTKADHTKARVGSGGKKVRLDTHVLNRHTQQVIYDLEMGDAILDAYKILHHPKLRRALNDMGRREVYEALDLWLGDVTTGEVQRAGLFGVENGLRAVRTGISVSALAFNVGVAALQPLGLLQSAVHLGKRNVLKAMWDVLASPAKTGNLTAPYEILQWVTSQSGFMQERERSFNKEMIQAQRGLTEGWLASKLPGDTAGHISSAAFMFIAKAQRMADFVTWLAAYNKAMNESGFDHADAVTSADGAVRRAQGSGLFSNRTAVERGTLGTHIRQTEFVRGFSLFINYFAAKIGVAYERTKNTNFRNPLKVAHWATDMALMFAVEGAIASLIREGEPEDEDEESGFGAYFTLAVKEGAKGVVAGIPFVREFAAKAEGFSVGGAAGAFTESVVKMGTQVSQGEFDAALLKSTNRVLGVFVRHPASQMNKTGEAMALALDGEDVEVWEYFLGPRRNR